MAAHKELQVLRDSVRGYGKTVQQDIPVYREFIRETLKVSKFHTFVHVCIHNVHLVLVQQHHA
jgi:hypothetical protein